MFRTPLLTSSRNGIRQKANAFRVHTMFKTLRLFTNSASGSKNSPTLFRKKNLNFSTTVQKTGQSEVCQGDSDQNLTIEQNNVLIFKDIANGDPELERKLKILEFEVAILRERLIRVPSILKKENWEELLKIPGPSARTKYLDFLFQIEKKRENKEANKQKLKDVKIEKWKNISKDHHLPYGIGHNTMFLRIYDQTLLKLLSQRLAAASLYSQHIVFDCSYTKYMSEINMKFCVKQIILSYSLNRLHPAPFHLKLCNLNPNDNIAKYLHKYFVAQSKDLPVDSVKESYLDFYPKEKLVYLTPHTKDVLFQYNHDDVYIIGAYVDRGAGKKVSLAKAKELNLRMAKLPIDHYLEWQKGTKSLPLNIVLNILLDMRLHGKWESAFSCIPLRCLFQDTNKKNNLKRTSNFEQEEYLNLNN